MEIIFSLSGEAKQWYIRVVGCVNGSWIELRDIFCSAFFLLSRICAQNDKESIGVAWARFTLLVKSGPDLSLPEHLLLQHFYASLDKESAHHLNIMFGGSFAYLTPNEGKEVLNRIMDRTSFVGTYEPTPAEPEVCQEEVPVIESELLESQSVESTPEPSSEFNPRH